MKLSRVSHFTTLTREANKWSPREDFILETLVGIRSYAEIGLLLGRSKASVQRRASRKGLSARSEWSSGTETRTRLSEARRSKILSTPESELAEFCVVPEEDPVLPHPGGRTYHKEYKRRQREKAKEA